MDWELILRYLEHRCSEIEAKRVEEWIRANESNQEMFETAKRIWSATEAQPHLWRTDAAWQKISTRLKEKEVAKILPLHKTAVKETVEHSHKNKYDWVFRYVAMIIVIIGISWMGVRLFYHSDHPAVVASIYQKVITTQRGQRKKLTLKDGTQIVLAPDSKLKIEKDYNQDERRVFLEGEAYFQVTYNKKHPFRVETAKSVAHDLGTVFNIKAYPKDDRVRVVVVEGKVGFQPKGDASDQKMTVLHGGNSLSYNNMNGSLTVSDINADRYVNWVNGVLDIDDQPFTNLTKDLERWYGVRIEVKDTAFNNKHITAEFKLNKSIDEILTALSVSMNLKIHKQAPNVYVIE